MPDESNLIVMQHRWFHCGGCDTKWRGPAAATSACWCCGIPGVPTDPAIIPGAATFSVRIAESVA